MLAALAGALACDAHAGFICRDPWLNTYRLASAPTGLACEADPPDALPAPPGSAVAEPAPAGALRLGATGTAQGGRLVLRFEPVVIDAGSRRGEALEQLIADAAARYGHPTNLLKAIVHVESRFNATAVSPKGAIGLMQLMPETARELGVVDPSTRLFDPAINLDAGARLLRQLLDRFSDRPELALAAYNAGAGAVLRYGREMPPYPETRAYVRDVAAEFARLAR